MTTVAPPPHKANATTQVRTNSSSGLSQSMFAFDAALKRVAKAPLPKDQKSRRRARTARASWEPSDQIRYRVPQPLCSCSNRILVAVGRGRRSQLWVLEHLQQNPRTGRCPPAGAELSLMRLAAVALAVLWLV